jgi:hypothetical protein
MWEWLEDALGAVLVFVLGYVLFKYGVPIASALMG